MDEFIGRRERGVVMLEFIGRRVKVINGRLLQMPISLTIAFLQQLHKFFILFAFSVPHSVVGFQIMGGLF